MIYKMGKDNLKNVILFFCGVWIINGVSFLVFSILSMPSVYIYILTFLLCFSYVFSLCCFIKKANIMSLESLFLICLGVFCLGRLFLYLIGKFDFMNAPYAVFPMFRWENSTAYKVLNYYLIFISIFTMYSLISGKKEKMKECSVVFSGKDQLIKLFSFLFYISGPILAIFYLKEARIVSEYGYSSYYNGTVAETLNGNILLPISRLCFTISFYTLCTLENREKKFNKIAIVYLLITGVQLLRGARAEFIIAFLTICYIRYRIFGKGVRFKTICILAMVAIPGIYFVSLLRNGELKSFNLLDSINYFFISLSGSLNVPAYYVQNKDILPLHNYPYIFEPIIRLFLVLCYPEITAGQSEAVILVRQNLSHQITYHMSNDYYLSGANVGNNFLAELMEFGLPGIFIGSFFLAYAIKYYDERFCSNLFFRFMSIEFVGKILFEPRAEYFYDTYNLFKYGTIYLFVCILGKIILSIKRRS